MAKKSVSYKEYLIEIEENGSVSVSKNGSACDKAKPVLKEIAEQTGFTVEDNWTTQQLGAKLVKFLSDGAPAASAPAASAPAPKSEKPKDEPNVEGSKADIAGARVRV